MYYLHRQIRIIVRKVNFAHRQFTYYKLNLRYNFLKYIKPCNPSNSSTWRVSFFISVVLSYLQKFINFAKIGVKILSVSTWVVLFQKRWTSVNTGFVDFVTNFFKWMCEWYLVDFCKLFFVCYLFKKYVLSFKRLLFEVAQQLKILNEI